MEELQHISDVVQNYISGDWGEESNIDGTLVRVACVRGADINDVNASKFDDIPIRYVSKLSSKTKGLQVGDIVIEKSGGTPSQSTGRVAYISEECKITHQEVVCSNFCAAFRVKEDWDARYIFYYLQFFYTTGVFFNFEGKTSGLHNLDIEHAFQAIPIKKIPLTEQKRISSILTNIDKKIALNHKINEELEDYARKLYNYWFVQFNFPNNHGEPYKASGGALGYSQVLKREIPIGWEVCKLEDYIANVHSGEWGKDVLEDGSFEIRCIRGADINSLVNLPIRFIKDKEKLLKEHDIVIEVSGGSPTQATGRSAYITTGVIKRNGGKLTCSNFCQVLSLKDYRKSPFFYYSWRLLYQGNNMFNYESKTSGIRNFMTELFLKNYWLDVPQNLANDFFEKISIFMQQVDTNTEEILALKSQREKLLPLLMNGQVCVNE